MEVATMSDVTYKLSMKNNYLAFFFFLQRHVRYPRKKKKKKKKKTQNVKFVTIVYKNYHK